MNQIIARRIQLGLILLFILITLLSISIFAVRVEAGNVVYTTNSSVIIGGPSIALRRPVIQVSTSTDHTCALATNQQIYCAGKNNLGQIGNPSAPDPTITPTQFQLPAGLTAKQVDTNYWSETCAITSDSQVYCAGYNNVGQLGDNSKINRSTPVRFQLPAGKSAVQVDHSFYNTCALTNDGLVYCAGADGFGQLGNGNASSADAIIPTPFISGLTAQKIRVGNNITCALRIDEQVYCAGYNPFGQIGNGNTTTQHSPVRFNLPAGVNALDLAIDRAGNTVCALTTNQNVYCSGQDTSGKLGNSDGVIANVNSPVRFDLPAGKTAFKMDLTDQTLCVLTTDQLVYCAGQNTNGQLGNGNSLSSSVPVAFNLPIGKTAYDISADRKSTCVLTADQLVYCAGDNERGALGDLGYNDTQSTPISYKTPPGTTIQRVIADDSHGCVIISNQQLYCAGLNADGQLGNGTTGFNNGTAAPFLLP